MAKKNPTTMTKSELLDYVSDLEDTLDSIYDLACPDDDTTDDSDSDDDDSDGDSDDDDDSGN